MVGYTANFFDMVDKRFGESKARKQEKITKRSQSFLGQKLVSEQTKTNEGIRVYGKRKRKKPEGGGSEKGAGRWQG